MKINRLTVALGFIGAIFATAVMAAGFLTNGLTAAVPPLSGLELFAADTGLPSGLTPASEAVSLAQLLQGSSTDVSNATSFTATAAQLVNGALTRVRLTGAPATAQNLTTPTAALLIAALPPGTAVGYTWVLSIVNVGGTSSGVWTVVGGSNVTVSGNATVAVAGSRRYIATWATATTVTLTDIGN